MQSFDVNYDTLAIQGERYLTQAVMKAVEEYVEGYFVDRYEPKQEFCEAEVREYVKQIVLEATDEALGRLGKQLREYHEERWQEKKGACDRQANRLWDFAVSLMVAQAEFCRQGGGM